MLLVGWKEDVFLPRKRMLSWFLGLVVSWFEVQVLLLVGWKEEAVLSRKLILSFFLGLVVSWLEITRWCKNFLESLKCNPHIPQIIELKAFSLE